MTTTLRPIRLPEGGRAALSFPYEGDWDATQKAAMYGASRSRILRDWSQFPQFVRQDQGFQALMDCYSPRNDEEYDLQESRKKAREQQVVERVRSLIGSRFDPRKEITDEEVIAAIQGVPGHNACVDFAVPYGNSGVVVLTNSTSRTVVGAQCAAQQAIRAWGLDVGFDGTTSTNAPGICEFYTNTWATNAPGTNSTSVTAGKIDSGRPGTVQTTCGKAWTTEPTVLTAVEAFFIPNYMGSGIIFTPLTKPFVAKGGNGVSLRITQGGGLTANTTGTLKCEEAWKVPTVANRCGGEQFAVNHHRPTKRPLMPSTDPVF